MDVLTGRLAKIIFALPFGVFGIFHLMNTGMLAQYVLDGWPAANVLVIVSGLAMLAAAIAIITGIMARLASLLLALLLLIYVLGIHLPAMGADETGSVMSNLLKDFSLMGGALMAAGLFKSQESV